MLVGFVRKISILITESISYACVWVGLLMAQLKEIFLLNWLQK